MYPAIKAALPKSEIVANMNIEARDGPLHRDGVDVISLFHYQGTSRTVMMVDQCNRQTPTGKLLNLWIEDLVLEAGLYGPLWGMPIEKISSWVSKYSLVYHTCIYNDDNNIIVSIPHNELKSAREGYQSLISIAIKNFHKTAELKAIQQVIMMIGVINVSDFCTSDSRSMDTSFLLSK